MMEPTGRKAGSVGENDTETGQTSPVLIHTREADVDSLTE